MWLIITTDNDVNFPGGPIDSYCSFFYMNGDTIINELKYKKAFVFSGPIAIYPKQPEGNYHQALDTIRKYPNKLYFAAYRDDTAARKVYAYSSVNNKELVVFDFSPNTDKDTVEYYRYVSVSVHDEKYGYVMRLALEKDPIGVVKAPVIVRYLTLFNGVHVKQIEARTGVYNLFGESLGGLDPTFFTNWTPAELRETDNLTCYWRHDTLLYGWAPGCAKYSARAPNATQALISLSPNPTADFLDIHGLTGPAAYQLSDALGRILLTGEYADTLDLRGLPPGVYVLTLRQGGRTSTHKIIKL